VYGIDEATDPAAAVENGIRIIGKMRAAYPDDARVATLIYQLAAYFVKDDQTAIALFKQIKREFPESPESKRADGKIRQYEAIGKPFDLAFTDAITGTEVSMQQLRGKVVVIDFWATWCGPCIAEMPNMKKWYAEYKPQGVEFLGISLDTPRDETNPTNDGLAKLKAYVTENDVQWPQYYQGNYWQSEFSSSWGINSIPSVFVVDADGNLFSVSARGKLEEMIPALIAKRDGKAGG
jgi:thiol-disulfide isomerase/thioredoxin